MLSSVQCYSTIRDVRNCPLKVPPGAGHLWAGLPHGELIGTLLARFKELEMAPIEPRFDLSRDGADLTAGWQFVSYPTWKRGINAGFAVSASNAMRKLQQFYVGAVEESTGTPVVTEVFNGWRYVKDVDLTEASRTAVTHWIKSVEGIGDVIDTLRSTPLTNREVGAFMMAAGRRKILPWTRIGNVDREFRRSTGDPTAWGLMRAFWKSAATSPARDQMTQVLLFGRLVRAGARALAKETA